MKCHCFVCVCDVFIVDCWLLIVARCSSLVACCVLLLVSCLSLVGCLSLCL